jgi:hemoglobin
MQTAWFKWLTTLAAGLCVVGFLGVGPAAGQATNPPAAKPTPPPVDKGQIDQHLNDFLRDAINQGADLYNNGDANACYNLFRSALVAAWYMLDHHPDLRRDINAALSRADGQFAVSDRAYTLRSALDATRKGLATGAAKPTEAKAPGRPMAPARTTLWERLGGQAKVRKVIDDLVVRAGKNSKVDFTRGGKYNLNAEQMANFKKQMVDLISQETGGPFKYDGRPLQRSHEGMGITDAQFDALVADLRKALADNNVQTADIDALIAVVETTRGQIIQKAGGTTKPADTKPADSTKPAPTKPPVTNPTTGQGPDFKKPADSGKPATEPKPQDTKPPKGDTTRPPQTKNATERKPSDKGATDSDKPLSNTLDIKGTVTFQGKPLAEATVAFVPKGEGTGSRRRLALTTANGSYSIKDIQLGEYTIAVIPPKTAGVPEKYKDAQTSGLTAKVTREDTTFDLPLK